MSTSASPAVLHQASPHQEFELLIPLSKSISTGANGSRKIHGVASDEKIDADVELVKASGKPGILDYLRDAGVLNYDHRHTPVGYVTGAEFLDKSVAAQMYGKPIEGTAVRIEGEIHPLLGNGRDPADLEEVHRLIDCGHPLFFSIQGTRERQTRGADGVVTTIPGIISQVAITTQPKNTNAVCVLAKSMGEVLNQWISPSGETSEAVAVVQETVPGDGADLPSRLVFQCAPLEKSEIAKSEGAGMVTTGAVPAGGTTGADAAKVEQLDGHTANQALGNCCNSCKSKLAKGAKFCSCCGAENVMSKSVSSMVADLVKSQVKAYTRKDGTNVKAHADKRVKKVGLGVFRVEPPSSGTPTRADHKRAHIAQAKHHDEQAKHHDQKGNTEQADHHKYAAKLHRGAARVGHSYWDNTKYASDGFYDYSKDGDERRHLVGMIASKAGDKAWQAARKTVPSGLSAEQHRAYLVAASKKAEKDSLDEHGYKIDFSAPGGYAKIK